MLRLLVIVAIAGSALADAPPVVVALKGLDPVQLTEGREVAGKDDLTAVHGRYKYQFVTAESKAVFEKAPARYAIQWGGACARMGPMSGQGNSDRWYVYEKRIYIFASDACREGFRANPAKHIDSADDAPGGTADQKKRGGELVALALKSFGGAEAVDKIQSLRLTYRLAYPQKGKPDFVMTRQYTYAFPDRFRQEDSYEGWSGVYVSTPTGGFATSRAIAWPLDDVAHAALRRDFLRDPLVILRLRNEKGFAVASGGTDKVNETEVELLAVGVGGATTTLAVDPKTGRVLQSRYRGRAPNAIGAVFQTYSDFQPAAGLTVPHGHLTVHDGRRVTIPAVTLTAVAVNEKLDPKVFVKPE